jgi:hypothetical protein
MDDYRSPLGVESILVLSPGGDNPSERHRGGEVRPFATSARAPKDPRVLLLPLLLAIAPGRLSPVPHARLTTSSS